MSSLDESQWVKLGNPPAGDDELIARIADPDATESVLIGIDGLSRRHILVPLKAGEQELRDSESRGIQAVTRDLAIPGAGTGRFIDIRLMDDVGRDAFNLVAGDCITGIAASGSEPAKVIGRIIAKWRRFWRSISSGVLSHEEQIGLFAEAWFLLYWLLPRLGAASVSHWRGPHGSRHDFEFPTWSAEVKATTLRRGPVFGISSLEQLDPPEAGTLFLFGMQLRDEMGGQHSLPRLVSQIRQALIEEPAQLETFDAGLAAAGYSESHRDQYDRLVLRVVEQSLYNVNDKFPHLTRSDLPAKTAHAIEQVGYLVNLSSYDSLIVARVPSEFPTDGE